MKRIIQRILSEFPNVHGTVVVAQGDKILWHHGFSYPDAPYQTDKKAQYLIASVTKQFTAVSLLKALYDRQIKKNISIHDTWKLKTLILKDLHTPLKSFLTTKHPLLNGPMAEWAHQVTLHHLLTHTSGIRHAHEPLVSSPSERYIYSNFGYMILGDVIQKITHTKLDDYFNHVLFFPSRMQNTHLILRGTLSDLKSDPRLHKLSGGFEKTLESKGMVFHATDEKLDFETLASAGGIISTACDLVRWNHALYSGLIIPQFLVDMMTTQYIKKDAFIDFDGFDTLEYGYGLDIYEQNTWKIYQHCGGTAGYQAKISYIVPQNITIINLSNISEDKPSIFPLTCLLRDLLVNQTFDE